MLRTIIAIAALCSVGTVRAQLCTSPAQNVPGLMSLNPQVFAQTLSTQLGRSVLIESTSSDSGEPQALGFEPTVEEVVRVKLRDASIQCIDQGTLQFVSPAALRSKANALNLVFPSYVIEENPYLFCARLASTLRRDAFAGPPKRDNHPIGEGESIGSGDAPERLKPETLHYVSGRDVLVRAAGQARIVLLLQLPSNSSHAPRDAWLQAQGRWFLNVIPTIQQHGVIEAKP